MRDYEEMDERTAQEYLERYVASLPDLRERFARRLTVTGGPVVDTSVEALADLDPWYGKEIQDPTPDGLDGVPLWWDADIEGPTPTDAQLRLVDEVGAHLAAVLQLAVRGADWGVMKQPGGSRTYGHHSTVLQVGPAQLQPWRLAYGHLPALLTERPLRPNMLQKTIARVLLKAGVPDG